MVASTAQTLTECTGTGAAGGIQGGGGTVGAGGGASCGASTSVQCMGSGRGVRATITPLDCDLKTGFVGDPQRLQTRCEEALDGQSGQSCQAPFSCGRSVIGTCCVQLASCATGSALRRYSVCPSACLDPSPASNVTVSSCDGLTSLWRLDASPAAWLGAPCAGQFVCPSALSPGLAQSSVPSTESYYYCANGALQMLPLFIVAP